ncbi:MAG: sensor histidine kinase [Nitrospira sp.]
MSRVTLAVLEMLPDPAVLLTVDGRIIAANKAFAALLGSTPERLKEHPLAGRIGMPEAELREITGLCSRTSGALPFAAHLWNDKGEVTRYRLQGVLLDRGDAQRSATLCLRFTSHARATREFHQLNEELVALKTEVLARRKAQVALRESEYFYRQTLDSIPGMVFTNTPDGACDYVSNQWVEYTGVPAEEQLGSGWTQLLHPDDRERTFAAWRKAVEDRGEYDLEYRVRRWDGTYEWFKTRGRAIRDEQGSILRWFGTAVNVDDLKQAEEAIAVRTAALAEANNELESFSYSVSHDLRAPLRTIDSFSAIIEEENGHSLDDEGRRCLGIVRKAATQAGELIDDLLELARLGRQSMRLGPVAMTVLARNAADELLRAAQRSTLDLHIGEMPPCLGDARLLKLVWANLLGNAIKYTRTVEAARIEVGWLPDDQRSDMAIYWVKDNGVGFNMEHAHQLFGVFRRLHGNEFEGTGVGLAIVQRIVGRHGGRAWAEGKINGGATFYFTVRKAEA